MQWRLCIGQSYGEEKNPIIPITWVDIPETNADFPSTRPSFFRGSRVPVGVGFTGEMSRYPTTNAQYAEYLNAALASGDIEVDGNQVKGTTGDYAGELYYRMDGPGAYSTGPFFQSNPINPLRLIRIPLSFFSSDPRGGKSRIKYNYRKGMFTVERGFENHPVTYVSWYGAMAFASYYGWRLPTALEWDSVANYNDNRVIATGSVPQTFDQNLANYKENDSHEYAEFGTTPVGHFGYYGYGLADMAGNVWEATNSYYGTFGKRYKFLGGSWYMNDVEMTVEDRYWFVDESFDLRPSTVLPYTGFRVCRD